MNNLAKILVIEIYNKLMNQSMKLKYLLFGGIALLMAACADDSLNSGNDNGTSTDPTDASVLSKASYTVGGGDQNRATNLGRYGSGTRSSFGFGIPEYSIPSVDGVAELPVNNYRDLTGDRYLIPKGRIHSEELSFNGSGEKTIYIQGKLTGSINMRGKVILLPGGEINASLNGGSFELTICEGAIATINSNISDACKAVYNYGELELPYGGTLSNGNTLYGSKNSKTYIGSTGDWYANGNIDVAGTVEVNGKIIFQNSYKKNICRLIAKEILINNNVPLYTTCVEAETIELQNDNCDVIFYDYGTADFNLIKNPNKKSSFFAIWDQADENVKALVTTKEITVGNEATITSLFHENVYLNLKEGSSLDPENIILWSANAVNNENLVIPVGNGCSEGYNVDGDPEPEPEPSLDQVFEVDPITHDHDSDKTDEHRRHLSATSLTFDGAGNIYASYHMRGGNWGNDTYDKDDIEGCIERWSFSPEGIEIGNWMWTNEFDFNHIILDGNYVVTVGHKGGETQIEHNGKKYTDFGGIIGRMPTGIWENNWDADDELTREDFQYKYLTTEVPLYGDYFNPNQGTTTNQIIDYKSAGDGNCVVRLGNEYFVATSAGYGKISAKEDDLFKRIKDEDGNVEFVSTPGSSKYLVNDGNNVHVLYLNARPQNNSEANTSFSASLATMATSVFPAKVDNPKTMGANVTPVDGKNVIAVKDDVVYACLSKGGLQIGDGSPITFSDAEDGSRSVNGVAVDDKYIYVANGSYITVLDKATHTKVVERKGNTKNVSANFVEVNEIDGVRYIFVAFGQEGIKVYKFNEV